jgi:hydrogenase-4 component F
VTEILFLLGLPLAGCVVLLIFGAHPRAAVLNVAFSLAAFVAAGFLTARVVEVGSLLAADELFFVDSFNVFLVALTAFVAFTTALFSRP